MQSLTSFNIAYFVSHPIQYQAPLLRLLAKRPEINLKVFFISDISLKSYTDKGFGTRVKWDVPLVEGYDYTFLPKVRDNATLGFFHPLIVGIQKALKERDWDAVWFHGYAHYALFWGIMSAVRMNIPVFFRSESNLICSPQGFLKNHFIRWLVNHASALLWVSSENRNYYKYYGAREEQLFFTPYAVDNEYFQKKVAESKEKVAELKRELDLESQRPIILYASKFIKRKNPALLLEAYARLSEDGEPPPAYLLFVGDGEQRPALEASIAELGWQNHVRLLGFKNQSELPAYFALCDLFVLPSEKEPFGLVINEVMNAGKAMISTHEVGASRDLVQDGRNGFVVPASDINALSRALHKAISDKERLSHMGAESLKIINDWNYEKDIEGIVQALWDINKGIEK